MSKHEMSGLVNILKLVASVAYLFMGIFVLIQPEILKTIGADIPQNFGRALAIILIVYGLLRLYRVYQSYTAVNEDTGNQNEQE